MTLTMVVVLAVSLAVLCALQQRGILKSEEGWRAHDAVKTRRLAEQTEKIERMEKMVAELRSELELDEKLDAAREMAADLIPTHDAPLRESRTVNDRSVEVVGLVAPPAPVDLPALPHEMPATRPDEHSQLAERATILDQEMPI